MLSKLLVLLHSKIALTAIGLTLALGAGTVAATAATGHSLPAMLNAAITATQGQQGPNEADGDNNDGAHNDGQHCQSGDQGQSGAQDQSGQDGAAENDEQNETAQDTHEGTVGAVNSTQGTFTLTSGDNKTSTVVVSSGTTFHGSVKSLSDLKTGMQIEVEGATQSDGSIAATSVSAGDSESGGDNQCGSTSGDNTGGDNSGGDNTGGSGSGDNNSSDNNSGGSGSDGNTSGGSTGANGDHN